MTEPGTDSAAEQPSTTSTGRSTDHPPVNSTRRGFLVGVGSVSAVGVLPSSRGQQDTDGGAVEWSQYNGNAGRTGRSALRDPGEPARTRWTLEVPVDGTGEQFRTGPVVAGETLFTANADGDLLAVDVPSGAVEWAYDAPGRLRIAPAVAADHVYLGSTAGDMVALDRESGEERWRAGVDRGVSTPAVRDGRVFFGRPGEEAAEVLAFEAASGELLWRTDVPKTEPTDTVNDLTVPTPAVAGGAVVANVQNLADSGDSGLVGLDPTDGTERWRTPLGGTCYPPSATGTACYAIANGGVSRVSLAGGSVRWETVFERIRDGTGVSVLPGMVTVGEEKVYLQEPTGITSSGFVALDKSTGGRTWTYALDSSPSVGSGVSTTGSRVYFALQGRLVAVDAENGLEAWSYRLQEEDLPAGRIDSRQMGAAPVVTQDGLLVKHLGTIFAVDDGSADGSGEQSPSDAGTPAPTSTAAGSSSGGADSGQGVQREDATATPERGFFTNGEDPGLLPSFRGTDLTVLSTLITILATGITILDMIRGDS